MHCALAPALLGGQRAELCSYLGGVGVVGSCDPVSGGDQPCCGEHCAFGGACVAAPLACVWGSGVVPCSCGPY